MAKKIALIAPFALFLGYFSFVSANHEGLPDFRITSGEVTGYAADFRYTNSGGHYFGELVIRLVWLDQSGNEISGSARELRFTTNMTSGLGYNMHETAGITNRPSGSAVLRIDVDPNNAIAETDESNNRREIVPGYWDFSVESPTVTGGVVRFTYRNLGTASYRGNLRYRLAWLRSDNTEVSHDEDEFIYSADLPAGSSRVFTTANFVYVIDRPAGGAKLRITVNPPTFGALPESNSANNSVDYEFVLPDLRPEAGELRTDGVRFSVRNVGRAAYSGTLPFDMIWLGAGDAELGSNSRTFTISSLTASGSGAVVTRTFSDAAFVGDPPDGAAKFRIRLNPNNTVEESDGTNNILDLDLPDLTIATASMSGSAVSYTVRNDGTATAGFISRSLTWLDENRTALDSFTFSTSLTLGSGASSALTYSGAFVATIPPPAKYLRITVDPNNAVGERNNDNNTFELTRPLPDLVVQNPTLTATGVRFTVRNSGSASWGGDITERFAWLRTDRSEIANYAPAARYASLAVGGNVTYVEDNSFFTAPPASAAFLRLALNSGHSPVESNYENSIFDLEFPDFVAETGRVTSSSLTYNIRNRGGSRFDGLLSINLAWLGAENNILSQDTSGRSVTLAAGATTEVTRADTFIVAPPAGAERLRIRLDPANVVAESDNNNNELVVERSRPDFVVEAVSLNHDRLDYRLRNIGERGYVEHLPMTFVWLNGETALATATESPLVTLTPGSTRERNLQTEFIRQPPVGAEQLRIVVNPERTIRETNFDNNSAGIAPSYPDFTVDTPVVTSTGISYTLRNQGADFSRTLERRFEWLNSDNSVLASTSISGLANLPTGSTASFTQSGSFVLTRPEGAARLRLMINSARGVAEMNYDNNSAEAILLTEDTTAEELAEADEEEAAAEVEEELAETEPPAGQQEQEPQEGERPGFRPKVLPGNPLYAFKNFGREIKSAVIFNPEAKAELRLRYANEKILEANLLSDQGKHERAAKHLASYAKDVSKAEQLRQKLQEKDQQAAEKFAEKLVRSELKQQVLLGKFERKAAEFAPQIKEAKNQALKETSQALASVEKSNVEQIIDKGISQDGSPFRSLRNLEVLKAVKEQVPDKAKAAISRAEQNTLDQLQRQLEALPEKHQKLLTSYVEKSGGDKEKHLETLRKVESKISKPEVKQEIGKARKVLRQAGLDSESRELLQKLIQARDRLQALINELEAEKRAAAEVKGARIAALIVNTNVQAINAQNKLNQTTNALSGVFERISSGLRVNKAADDAAGLGVSASLDSEISAFKQAVRNADDAISVVETAEGASNEIANIVRRMRELAVQSANETLATDDRSSIDEEFDQLTEEVTTLMNQTRFEGSLIYNGTAYRLELRSRSIDSIDAFSQHLRSKNEELRDLVRRVLTSVENEIRLAELQLAKLRREKNKPVLEEKKEEKKEERKQEKTEQKVEKRPEKTEPKKTESKTETKPVVPVKPITPIEPVKEIKEPVPVKTPEPVKTEPEPTKAIEPVKEATSTAKEVAAPVVKALPDLTVSSTVSPTSPVAGNAMSFTATVRNAGTGAAGASTTRIRIDIGGDGKWDLTYTAATGALAAGSSELEAWKELWIATAGTHKYEICADSASAVTESSETNNCSSGSFTVAAAKASTTDSFMKIVKGIFIRGR